MANLPWNFLTEGSLRLKDSIHQIIYHKSLNVVVVITQDGTSIVIDVNSGSALHRTSLVPPDQGKPNPEWAGKLTCLALPEHSALLISSNQAVGLRQDLGQVLLLESILQVPVSFQDAVIRIEMPGAEAMQLLQCLQSLDLSGEPDLVAHREQVADILTQQMRQSFSQSKAKFKTASWAIIYLELPLYSLRTVCLHAVQDMRRHNRHVPALPIASALAIRTAVLLKDNHPTSLSSVIQPSGAIGSNKELKTKAPTPAWKIAWEKVGEGEGSIPSPLSATLTNGPSHSWMVSEAARRETFYRWPHMKYKWALPEQMAEAGFYHQPNTPESDRAVCFQCNVCLICWEPNDEPWSEHERHAPLCQFVKGEYTQNVPIETTLATYPALPHSERGESIACLSTTSCPDYVATATQTGSVVLWNTSCVLKRDVTFSIDSQAISTFKAPSCAIHTSLNVEALSVLGSQTSGVSASRTRDEEASKPRPCLVVGVSVKSVHLERDDLDSTLQPDEKGQVEVLNDVNSRHKGLDIMEVDRDDSELSCATLLTSNWAADLYLLVYDVCQRKTSPPTPPTNKDEQEGGPIGSQPSSSTGSVKKSSLGGTTKKPGTGTTSSGTQQECSLYNQNRDMFYSVYDDPLVDDMMGFAEESAAGSSLQSKLKKVASFSYELGQAGSAFTNPVSMKVNPPLIDGFPYNLGKKETHDGVTTPNVTPTLVQKIDLKPFLQNNQVNHACVLSLTPSYDGKFLLVAVGPKPEPIVVKQKHEASFPTLLSDINDTTPSLMSDENQEAQLRALWSPPQDENGSVIRNFSSPGASQATGSLILLAINAEGEMMTVQEEPLMVQHISKEESPRATVMLPNTSDDAALVLVGQDGKLRLYDLLNLELKAETSHEEGFISATYCTNMERLCAATKEGVLCFYRINLNTGASHDEDFVDGSVGFSKMELDLAEENSKGKGKGKAPMKLLINQPLTQENLLQLHALTECENIPQGFSAVVPSCWLELPQAQKLRRQPQPLQAVGEEAHHTRTWRLQPDGSTWDEHLLEISLAQTWTLGHIDIRFTLVAGCTHVPQVQISLLEHRSSNAPLGMSKAWGDEEIAVEVDQGLEFTPLGGSIINPVLTTEFLETHDATLLCGPVALDTCLDSTGQSGTITLASPLLLAAQSRHYLIHLKYIPQGDSVMEQDSVLMQWPFRNISSKSVLDRLPLNSTKRPVKGCDMLQEISVSVRKTKPTTIPRDKLQRCMMLNNASFVGKLREEIIREPVVRLNQNLALDIAIWVVTVCSGMPDIAEKSGKAGSVILEELTKNLLPLVHRVWIHGYRTSAEKMAKLVLACLQLEKDCGGNKVFQKSLLEAQQEALPQLVLCDSPSAMYWFTTILSRLVSLDPQAVSDAAWALLNRVSQVYQSQTHPLHLLLQTRFGLYGKPFESVLFTLPSPGGLNMGGFSGPASINWGPSVNSKNTGSTSAGGSGAAMAGRLALDSKFALSAAALALGGEGKDVKDILKRGYGNHQLLIKDLTEVEPLVVTLCQASDGTRLEKLDAGPGLFGTTSSAGFVQTSSCSAAGASGSAGEKTKPFLWQHLLLAPHLYAWYLERLHSGARRFLTLDLGQPVLLTDICIPSCPEFVCLAVDVWLKKEETDGCRLALATDIASKPVMLLDLQPPPLCRYIKLTIVGRYGMSTTSVKTPLGYFYGHTVLVPNDCGLGDQVPLKTEQIQAELEVVEGLADQVTCHYHLATSKLQTLLWPLLDSRRCNPVISHVQHYLKSQLESQRSFSTAFKGQVSESDKVCSVYEECLRLQLQWNTLKGVAKRLRRALVELGVRESEPQENDHEEALKEAGSDKLQFLAHSLVNLLLSISSLQETTSQQSMSESACQTLFERLLVTAPPPLQLGGASLLAHHCGTEVWWGNFIANMVKNHLASRQEYPWPQDRVFLALTFMAHKTMAVSASKVLDALSQSLCQSLDVLDSCQSSVLPAMLCRVDLPFIHWHLLFMTYLLDRLSCVPADTEDEEGKENSAGSSSKTNSGHNLPSTSTGSASRWEFLQGESSLHKVNPLASSRSSAGRLFRRKLQKRLFHHKQQWEELELKKIFKDPAPELTSLAGSAKKVVGGYRTSSNPLSKVGNSNNNLNSGGGAGPIRRGDGSATSSTGTEERPREERRIIGWRHAVLLVRRLVQLLLLIGDNHQSDTFLLIAKVLGKVANIVRPVIHLGDVMTTDQLVELLQKAVKPSIIAGDAIAHQWMNHAITCLLQDFLAQSKKSNPATRFYNASSSNTFISVNPANVEENKESTASGVKTEDAMVMSEYMEGVEEESADALQNLPPKEASSSSAKAAGGSQSGLTQDTTDIDLLVSGLMEGANDFALSDEMYGHLLKAPKISKPIHIPPPTSTAATQGAQNGPFTLNELEPLPLSPEHLPFLSPASPTTPVMAHNYPGANQMGKHKANGVETFISKLLDNYPPDNYPKPPVCSRVVRVFPSKEEKLKEEASLSNISSASDSRMETRVEGGLGQKLELFCLLHEESVHQVMVNPIAAEVPAARIEVMVEDTLPSLCTGANISMLSTAFNQIFTQQINTMGVEAVSALRLWMQVNLEVSESPTQGVYEAATVPAIVLSLEAIRNLLAVLSRQPQMDVGAWCTLFQALSWLCNLRCTSPPRAAGTDAPPPASASTGVYDSVLEELAGIFLAGGILRDPALVPLLYNFLSGNALPPNMAGDRCWVGPSVTSALSDLLMRLRLWCSISAVGSRLGTELRRALLGLALQLCQPGGSFASGRGPLDAQSLLLDSMLKLVYDGADTPTCIALVEAVACLVHSKMEGCEQVTSSNSVSHVVNPFLCFGGLVLAHANKEMAGSHALATSDHIFSSLLQLASKLASAPLAPPLPTPSTASASTATPSVVFCEESLTDSSKIEQAESLESDSQTDERKVEQQNERASHSRPENKPPCFADVMLQSPSIVLALLSSLTKCQASLLALTLGPATLSGGKFPFGDPSSLGDHVIHLLLTLLDKTTNPSLIIAPLCRFLATTQNTTGLSDPLLWFVLHVLNTSKLVQDFHSASGVFLVANHVVRSHVALSNNQLGLVSNIIRYMSLAASHAFMAGTSGAGSMIGPGGSSSAVGTKMGTSLGTGILVGSTPATVSAGGTVAVSARKTPAAALESVEGLLNFAPLGSIASSNPSAQPADALLLSVPPHRRARTPAWSHHFYPSEHWVELTVTLPCAVLLHEIQLQPHLTSLATCPAAVALEVSAEGPASLSPVSGPVNTTGLAFIALKLPRPKIANVVLIRLYKPRDSSNVGLAQLRLLGSLAIPTGSGNGPLANSATLNKTPGVHASWIHLLHHCVETVTGNAQTALLTALSGLPRLVEGCCAHFVTLSSTGSISCSQKGDLKAKLHSVILRLGRLDCAVGLQCLQWFLDAESGGEAVAHLIYELCLTRDENVSQRLQCLLEWLQSVVQGQQTANPAQTGILIHCAAAVLWAWQETTDVAVLVAPFALGRLAQSIYSWVLRVSVMVSIDGTSQGSEGLENGDKSLKRALDSALCALAYVDAGIMDQVLKWTRMTSLKDDFAGSSLTDDSKGTASTSAPSTSATSAPTSFLFGLSPGQLTTIARTAQSPLASRKFFDCVLVKKLAQMVTDYCRNAQEAPDQNVNPVASTSRSLTDVDKEHWRHQFPRQQAQAVTQVLRFFTHLCAEGGFRNALIEKLEPDFMSVLISTFCRPGSVVNAHARSNDLEAAVVRFLQVFCWAHRENQRRLAHALYAVLEAGQNSGSTQHIQPVLSGFTRRLLFQLLLETEKLYLFVQSPEIPAGSILAAEILEPRHPKYGVGPQRRLIQVGANWTVDQVLDWLTNGSPTRGTGALFKSPSEAVAAAAAAAAAATSGTGTGAKAGTSDPVNQKLINGYLSFSDQLSFVLGTLNQEKRGKSGTSRSGLGSSTSKLEAGLNPFSKASIAQSLRSGLQFVVSNPTLHLSEWPGAIPGHVTFSQLYTWLERKGKNLDPPCIHLNISFSHERSERMDILERTDPFPTILQDFAAIGGLALLAHFLPLVTSDVPLVRSPVSAAGGSGAGSSGPGVISGNEPLDVWVKIEENEDLDDDIEEIIMSGSMGPGGANSALKKLKASLPLTLPQHSLAAFSLFLRIPLYADALLRDRQRAQMLLRLALGVCDDGEGGDIIASPESASLPTLPFALLKQLLITQPPSTDDGLMLRKKALEVGAVQLLLACLAVFTQQLPSAAVLIPGLGRHLVITAPSTSPAGAHAQGGAGNPNFAVSVPNKASYYKEFMPSDEDDTMPLPVVDGLTQTSTANIANNVAGTANVSQAPQYWAKGTGFGTGSTAQSWDVEEALLRQRAQEEQATCLVLTLAAYVRPEVGNPMEEDELGSRQERDGLPEGLLNVLKESCLVQAICSYLRNDSVMDMARHVPLYKALLQLVRALALSSSLSTLLCSPHNKKDLEEMSIFNLLGKMKDYVSTYAARIAATHSQTEDTDADGGLADLIADITSTWPVVQKAILQIMGSDAMDTTSDSGSLLLDVLHGPKLPSLTPEQCYMEVMRKLQFESFEMLVESEGGGYKFTVPFHFEGAVRLAGERSHPTRMKRLAQEAATLLTSLPLSASSSVFVRCDTDRLDVMKVLITGPADTPYANGCYEFDVYFPVDYPQSPMQIHLCTTGRQTIRFNPNLYNDGKVCLSVLNTWHGRPEEKWNSSTSSFLQVLVSIQSLILVSEPYFNEPGYERSRGTPSGTQNSRDYDANIRQASVRWAMLEQLRNPSACFKDVLQAHFWLKREEIEQQIEGWLEEMESQVAQDPTAARAVSVSLLALERHYTQLKEELSRLSPPGGVEGNAEGKNTSQCKPEKDENTEETREREPSGNPKEEEASGQEGEAIAMETSPSSQVPGTEEEKGHQEASNGQMIWPQDFGEITSPSWKLDSDEESDEFDSFISQFIV